MNGFIRFLCVFIFFFHQAASADKSCCLTARLNSLLNKSAHDINIAVIIADPTKRKIIYQKNSSHYFVPASTLKILTAYTALKTLTPDFRFQTSLIGDFKQLHSGVLSSNLLVKFDGDPTLSLNDLDQLFRNLKDKGVNKIKGNILLSDKLHEETWPLGIAYDDLKFCYAAPVGNIIIDENCFKMELSAENQKITAKYPQPMLFDAPKLQVHQSTDDDVELIARENNNYQIFGGLKSSLHLNIAIQNPRLYAKQAVRYFLNKYNIVYTGRIEFTRVKNQPSSDLTHFSSELASIIHDMLKDSNNCMANAVFKKLSPPQAEHNIWLQSAEVVKNNLQKAGVKSSGKIYDGAGASRYNLISPKQLLDVLNISFRDPVLRKYLVSALPIAGTDGTLIDRMQNIKGRVMAKTGTSSGISSLAGFIKTKQNRMLSFVIMINNGTAETKVYKDLEDKICSLLYEL